MQVSLQLTEATTACKEARWNQVATALADDKSLSDAGRADRALAAVELSSTEAYR